MKDTITTYYMSLAAIEDKARLSMYAKMMFGSQDNIDLPPPFAPPNSTSFFSLSVGHKNKKASNW